MESNFLKILEVLYTLHLFSFYFHIRMCLKVCLPLQSGAMHFGVSRHGDKGW